MKHEGCRRDPGLSLASVRLLWSDSLLCYFSWRRPSGWLSVTNPERDSPCGEETCPLPLFGFLTGPSGAYVTFPSQTYQVDIFDPSSSLLESVVLMPSDCGPGFYGLMGDCSGISYEFRPPLGWDCGNDGCQIITEWGTPTLVSDVFWSDGSSDEFFIVATQVPETSSIILLATVLVLTLALRKINFPKSPPG